MLWDYFVIVTMFKVIFEIWPTCRPKQMILEHKSAKIGVVDGWAPFVK